MIIVGELINASRKAITEAIQNRDVDLSLLIPKYYALDTITKRIK